MRHLCEHTSLTHLTTSTKYTCSLSIGINVLPGFWHTIWACGLSTSAANGRDFMVSTKQTLVSTKQMPLTLHSSPSEYSNYYNTFSNFVSLNTTKPLPFWIRITTTDIEQCYQVSLQCGQLELLYLVNLFITQSYKKYRSNNKIVKTR